MLDGRRLLPVEGCYNVRDVGGLPAAGGRVTRRGALVRADSIARVTDRGADALVAHGVRTVLDLRHQVEPEPCPLVRHGVAYENLPLFDPRDLEWMNDLYPLGSTEAPYAIFLERCAEACAAAVSAVARAREGGVLVHCQIGRDRTGIVVALLLDLVGVDAETIAADYALSEAALQPFFDSYAAGVDDPERLALIDRHRPSPASAMLGTLERLAERHGGAAGYLRGVGVAEAELERIRERLLER